MFLSLSELKIISVSSILHIINNVHSKIRNSGLMESKNFEFCDTFRLFGQYWEKKNRDEIVVICRKNLLNPVKLRKEDDFKCITGNFLCI